MYGLCALKDSFESYLLPYMQIFLKNMNHHSDNPLISFCLFIFWGAKAIN